jgi:hypothetical protein
MSSHHVPIVHRTLRPQEALLQTFDALADLDRAVNEVFSRIVDRVRVVGFSKFFLVLLSSQSDLWLWWTM